MGLPFWFPKYFYITVKMINLQDMCLFTLVSILRKIFSNNNILVSKPTETR